MDVLCQALFCCKTVWKGKPTMFCDSEFFIIFFMWKWTHCDIATSYDFGISFTKLMNNILAYKLVKQNNNEHKL